MHLTAFSTSAAVAALEVVVEPNYELMNHPVVGKILLFHSLMRGFLVLFFLFSIFFHFETFALLLLPTTMMMIMTTFLLLLLIGHEMIIANSNPEPSPPPPEWPN